MTVASRLKLRRHPSSGPRGCSAGSWALAEHPIVIRRYSREGVAVVERSASDEWLLQRQKLWQVPFPTRRAALDALTVAVRVTPPFWLAADRSL